MSSVTSNTLAPEYKVPRCPIPNRTIYMNKVDMVKFYKALKNAPKFEGRDELLYIFEWDLKSLLLELEMERDHLEGS